MLRRPFGAHPPSRRHGARTRLGLLGVSGLVLLGAPGVSPPAVHVADVGDADAESAEVVLACGMELCVVDVDYRLPRGSSSHELHFTWETRATAGYPDNESDRLTTSRVSRADAVGGTRGSDDGVTHSVREPLWHSDIRCDDHVRVTVSGPGLPSVTRSADKEVPVDPRRAHCSATDMAQ